MTISTNQKPLTKRISDVVAVAPGSTLAIMRPMPGALTEASSLPHSGQLRAERGTSARQPGHILCRPFVERSRTSVFAPVSASDERF